MAENITGKVAIITGGATGIGRAVAARLALGGADVVIAGRDEERGDAAVKALSAAGRRVSFVRTDVRYEVEVESIMERATDLYGGILGPIATNTEEVVEEVLAANFKGVFFRLKHVVPRLVGRGGGAVVNTASFVGTTVPFPDAVLYGATKAAVLSMTRAVAAGVAAQNVRVYAVCPWITDTPLVDRLTGHQAEVEAKFGAMNPSGRIVTPEDVAGVVVTILSGEAGLDSGDAVLVDGAGVTQKVRPMSA